MIALSQACDTIAIMQSVTLVIAEVVVTLRIVIALYMFALSKKKGGNK